LFIERRAVLFIFGANGGSVGGRKIANGFAENMLMLKAALPLPSPVPLTRLLNYKKNNER